MPRRVVKKKADSIEASFKVSEILVKGATQVITVDYPDGPLAPLSLFNGAFVRVRVVNEEAVEKDEDKYQAFLNMVAKKALKLIVLPRRKRELAVPVKAQSKAKGARQVVLEMVEESTSREKEKLRGMVENIMSEVGL